MQYLEMIIIVLAIVMEWEYLVKGREIHDLSGKDAFKVVCRGYPSWMFLVFWASSIGYIACALLWLFSSNLIIRYTAIALLGLSMVTGIWKKHPVWWNTVDRILSISCLIIVGYVRFNLL